MERAADEARAAGDERMLADAVGWEAASMATGPTSVDAAIVRCTEIREILRDNPWAQALAIQPLASLHAMRGEFDVALRLLASSKTTLDGFSMTVDAAVSHPAMYVAVLTGDLEGAERNLRAGRRRLEQMGERAVLASTESYLAQVLLLTGRDREADRLARRCARISTPNDAGPQVAWRETRARVLARRGQPEKALVVARQAVEIAIETDHLNMQADAVATLAFVLETASAIDDARSALVQAASLFEAKGNSVRAADIRKQLARLTWSERRSMRTRIALASGEATGVAATVGGPVRSRCKAVMSRGVATRAA